MDQLCANLVRTVKHKPADGAICAGLISAKEELRRDAAGFAILSRALIDHVALWIASSAPESCAISSRHFDELFLAGPSGPAFDALVSGLSGQSAAAETCARTLSLFVHRRLAGLSRVSSILVAPSSLHGTASALVHLPALVSNACQGTMPSTSLTEEVYYALLVDALPGVDPRHWRASDLATIVVGKLCTLGYATLLVQRRCLGDGSVSFRANRLAFMIIVAPPSAIPALFRSLITMHEVFGADPVRHAANVGVASDGVETSSERSAASTTPRELEIAEEALALFLRKDTTRKAWALQLIFTYPLLKKPRASLGIVVRSLKVTGALSSSLAHVLQRWSDRTFSSCEDVALQHQVTMALLLLMADFFRSETEERRTEVMHSLAVEVATGVGTRLSSTFVEVRRYGMLVGEAMSRSLATGDKPLRFNRDPHGANSTTVGVDGFESDGSLSDIAMLQLSDEDSEVASDEDSLRSTEEGPSASSPTVSMPSKRTVFDESEWDFSDDDWSTLDSYPLSDDDSDGYKSDVDAAKFLSSGEHSRFSSFDMSVLRKEISAPFSVTRILGVLRKLNGGDSDLQRKPAVILSTLRALSDRAETSNSGLDESEAFTRGATEMTSAVFGVDWRRFPESIGEDIGVQRKRALAALVLLDIGSVGGMLIDDVFSSDRADQALRVEAINLVRSAARDMLEQQASRADAAARSNAEAAAGANSLAASQRLGRVTKEFKGSLQTRKEQVLRGQRRTTVSAAAGRRLSDTAEPLFYSIAAGVSGLQLVKDGHVGGSTMFAQAPPLGTESLSQMAHDTKEELAAHGLITLSALVPQGAAGRARDDMALALVDVSAPWMRGGTALARRAAALALGSAADALGKAALASGGAGLGALLGDASAAGSALGWLREAADGADPDVHVRQFAARALASWGARIAEARDFAASALAPSSTLQAPIRLS